MLARKNKGYPLFLEHRAARRACWDELFFHHQMGSYHRMLVLALGRCRTILAIACRRRSRRRRSRRRGGFLGRL